jgi:hypothetical protein
VTDSTDAQNSDPAGLAAGQESSYGPHGFKPAEPASFVWTVRHLDADSEDGQRLRVVQAAAVRKVLECLRHQESHPPSAA